MRAIGALVMLLALAGCIYVDGDLTGPVGAVVVTRPAPAQQNAPPRVKPRRGG